MFFYFFFCLFIFVKLRQHHEDPLNNLTWWGARERPFFGYCREYPKTPCGSSRIPCFFMQVLCFSRLAVPLGDWRVIPVELRHFSIHGLRYLLASPWILSSMVFPFSFPPSLHRCTLVLFSAFYHWRLWTSVYRNITLVKGAFLAAFPATLKQGRQYRSLSSPSFTSPLRPQSFIFIFYYISSLSLSLSLFLSLSLSFSLYHLFYPYLSISYALKSILNDKEKCVLCPFPWRGLGEGTCANLRSDLASFH